MVKELGKIPPYLRDKEDPVVSQRLACWWGRGVAENREKRLFIKNTGACEAVRRCIRTDACPVLEG